MANNDSSDRIEHLWILGLALSALIASFVVRPSAEGGLELPIPGTGRELSLPEACMSRRLLGISCPGCGLSRSFVAMSRGDLTEAVRLHPLGPLLYLLCWLQIPYRIGEYMGAYRFCRCWAKADQWLYVVTWIVLAALLSAWIVRMVAH